MTYHLPVRLWHRCRFADELEHAPEFDGHTSDDVLKRVRRLSDTLWPGEEQSDG